MQHIMIDLETLSTRSDSAILSIGAVFFDIETGQLGDELHIGVKMEDHPRYGHIHPDTVRWWLSQSEPARAELLAIISDGYPLEEALTSLKNFLQLSTNPGKLSIWANPSSFDPTILDSAYRRCDSKTPWNHWQLKDVSTIVKLGRDLIGFDPKHDNPFEGTPHNALSDAIHQAKYVSDIYQALRNRIPANL
jgi:hypothetical protein